MIPNISSIIGMELSRKVAESVLETKEKEESDINSELLEEPKLNGTPTIDAELLITLKEKSDDESFQTNNPNFEKEEETSYSSEDDEEKLIISEPSERKNEDGSLDLSKVKTEEKSSKRRNNGDHTENKRLKREAEFDKNSILHDDIQLDQEIAAISKMRETTLDLIMHKEKEWDELVSQCVKYDVQLKKLQRRKAVNQVAKRSIEYDDSDPKLFRDDSIPKSYTNLIKTEYRSSPIESNINVIDISTKCDRPQVTMSPDAQINYGRQNLKPILPKPFSSVPQSIPLNASSLRSSSPSFATGYGPQGPTVSVNKLIENARRENPTIPPMRGSKRTSWRNRHEDKYYRDPERPSSVSSTEGYSKAPFNNIPLSMESNFPFKDCLVHLAQLTQTQNEKTPQVSIIPVSSDHSSSKKEATPDSTSVAHSIGSNLEGSSALAKLLMESRSSGSGSRLPIDVGSPTPPRYLTLNAILGRKPDMKEPNMMPEARMKRDEIPPASQKCQGCNENKAQFVCAGCANQWYCSKNCQIKSWDEHSERCSPH